MKHNSFRCGMLLLVGVTFWIFTTSASAATITNNSITVKAGEIFSVRGSGYTNQSWFVSVFGDAFKTIFASGNEITVKADISKSYQYCAQGCDFQISNIPGMASSDDPHGKITITRADSLDPVIVRFLGNNGLKDGLPLYNSGDPLMIVGALVSPWGPPNFSMKAVLIIDGTRRLTTKTEPDGSGVSAILPSDLPGGTHTVVVEDAGKTSPKKEFYVYAGPEAPVLKSLSVSWAYNALDDVDPNEGLRWRISLYGDGFTFDTIAVLEDGTKVGYRKYDQDEHTMLITVPRSVKPGPHTVYAVTKDSMGRTTRSLEGMSLLVKEFSERPGTLTDITSNCAGTPFIDISGHCSGFIIKGDLPVASRLVFDGKFVENISSLYITPMLDRGGAVPSWLTAGNHTAQLVSKNGEEGNKVGFTAKRFEDDTPTARPYLYSEPDTDKTIRPGESLHFSGKNLDGDVYILYSNAGGLHGDVRANEEGSITFVPPVEIFPQPPTRAYSRSFRIVKNVNGVRYQSDDYSFLALPANGAPLPPPPALTSINPREIKPGAEMTLVGTNFGDSPRIMFDETGSLLAPSSKSATLLKITLPSSMKSGSHGVKVVDPKTTLFSTIFGFKVLGDVQGNLPGKPNTDSLTQQPSSVPLTQELPFKERLAALRLKLAGMRTQVGVPEQQTVQNSETSSTAIVSPSACPILTQNLTLGSTDKKSKGEVSAVQKLLVAGGYLSSAPTGYYGSMTVKAVKAFQKDMGLPSVGSIGPLTRAKIQSFSCE